MLNCDNILFKCQIKALLVNLYNDRQRGKLGFVGPAIFTELDPFLKSCRRSKPARCSFKCKTVVAIGDIHGDFMALLSALYLGSLIDSSGHWVGQSAIVVQLGDIFDRGGRGISENTSNNQREELDILQYIHALNKEARLSGGRVISLVGNHEADQFTRSGMFPADKASKYETDFLVNAWGGVVSKRRLFSPSSPLAKYFYAYKPLLVRIGDFVFCHGGLVPSMIQEGETILSMNETWQSFLLGQISSVPDNIVQVYWNRDLSLPMSEQASKACVKTINELIDRLGIPRETGGIVVAHTVQKNIPLYCEGKVWRIDVGLSEAFGRRSEPIEILRVIFSETPTVQVIRGLQNEARVEIRNFEHGKITWTDRIAVKKNL